MTTVIRDNSLSMLLLNAYRGRPLTFLRSHASCVHLPGIARILRACTSSRTQSPFSTDPAVVPPGWISLDEPASLLHFYARTRARFQKGISRQVDSFKQQRAAPTPESGTSPSASGPAFELPPHPFAFFWALQICPKQYCASLDIRFVAVCQLVNLRSESLIRDQWHKSAHVPKLPPHWPL